LLAPGNTKLKVQRRLFETTRIGNFVLVRRDALGKIEEIRRINNRSKQLARAGIKSLLKGPGKLR
jgi:hypothetical protein